LEVVDIIRRKRHVVLERSRGDQKIGVADKLTSLVKLPIDCCPHERSPKNGPRCVVIALMAPASCADRPSNTLVASASTSVGEESVSTTMRTRSIAWRAP
jgi:hypothetical protein